MQHPIASTTSRINLLPSAMKAWLCLLLVLCLWPSAWAANLTASVDKNLIGLNDTFTLRLQYDEIDKSVSPDLSSLQHDFEVLNTQSGSVVSIVNGQSQSYTHWTIDLAPRKIGKLIIPSFNIKGAVSDAIEITVEGKSKRAQADNIQVETLVEKPSLYVQEQLFVTVRLKIDANLSLNGGNMEPLQIKDALVIQLEDKKYRMNENGRLVDIIESRFAVYPQVSGEMIIPAILFQLDVGGNQWDMRSFFGTNRGNLIRLRTEEQRITVTPSPQDPKAQPWLPAQNLQLEEHWSTNPETLKVGDPITRTITIRAQGLSAAQLPPLPTLDIQGLSSYQDQAQTEDQKQDNGVTGSRVETTAIVANRSGSYTLPSIKLHWWDTQEKAFKTAELASTRLNVSSSANNMDAIVDKDSNTHDEYTSVPLNTELNLSANHQTKASLPIWVYVLLAASLLANVCLFWLYRQARLGKNTRSTDQQQDGKEQHSNEKAAWQQVREAIGNKATPEKLREVLLHWGRIFWQDAQLNSLDRLGRQFGSAELIEHLKQLDRCIYSQKHSELDLDALKQLLASLRQATQHKQEQTLKALYPH